MLEEQLKNIVFATPETVVQPKGTMILGHVITEQDHVLGGLLGDIWTPVLPDANWLKFIWSNPEIQRVLDGDLYWCVTFSRNSIWRFVWKVQYNEDFNISERLAAIGGGTVRGRGASKANIAEWSRKNGWEFQTECPTPNTLDAAYAPLTKDDFDRAKINLKTTLIAYKYLPDNSIASIKAGLTFSPVQVDVHGQYSFNAQGYVINNGSDYAHEVAIIADGGDFWVVWDSESIQWLKFDKGFKFGSPMIHSIKKSDINAQIAPYEGKQVKASKSSIYLIQNGQKRAYPDKLTFYCDGGLYGLDGTSYVSISDALLNFVPEGNPVILQETKFWPQVFSQLPLIQTLSEPQNLKEVKDLITNLNNSFKTPQSAAVETATPSVEVATPEVIVQKQSLFTNLLNMFKTFFSRSAKGRFGALSSSSDPEQLSTSVQGFLGLLGSAVLFYAKAKGVAITDGDISQIINVFGTLIAGLVSVYSLCKTLFGLARKMYFQFKQN